MCCAGGCPAWAGLWKEALVPGLGQNAAWERPHGQSMATSSCSWLLIPDRNLNLFFLMAVSLCNVES